MADSIDMILPMLREMRTENADRFEELAARQADVIAGIDKLEAAQVSFRHAFGADSLLGKDQKARVS